MNKFLELLEAHCQWIAVGIGGIFLALMLWSYILMPPVAIEAPGVGTLTPGNVDDIVFRRAAEPLDRELKRQSVETPPPQSQASLSLKFDELMAGKDRQVVTLGNNWAGSLPMQIDDLERIQAPVIVPETLVENLPSVPPTEPAGIKSARANVSDQLAGANPPPAAAPGQVVSGRDINYVFYQYRINVQDIATAFKAAGIPAGQQLTTSILAVEIYRQEQLPDGSWSEAKLIKGLKNAPDPWRIPTHAGPEDPETINFLTWIEGPNAVADMLRPQFYNVLMGEGPWSPPEELPVIDPAAERAAELERRREAYRQQQAERAAERANRAPQAAPPEIPMEEGPRRSRRNRGGAPIASDPERPGRYDELVGQQFAQARPAPTGGFFGFDENGDPIPAPPPGMGPDGQPTPEWAPPRDPNAGPQNVAGLPTGRFNPQAPGQPNFDGWAFDEEVEEGKTYRYQAVYAIRNPLFNTAGIGKPGLEKVFAIWSNNHAPHEDHWSAPVTIQPTTEYFLATNNNWGSNLPPQVSFEVFKWVAGKWQKSIKACAAGDRIVGTFESTPGTKANFPTGSTLVDIRWDRAAGRSYVVVLDHTGRLIEYDAVKERDNVRRRQLNTVIAAQASAEGGPGVGPGAGPAGNPAFPAARPIPGSNPPWPTR